MEDDRKKRRDQEERQKILKKAFEDNKTLEGVVEEQKQKIEGLLKALEEERENGKKRARMEIQSEQETKSLLMNDYLHEWFSSHVWTEPFIVEDVYKAFVEVEKIEEDEEEGLLAFSRLFSKFFIAQGALKTVTVSLPQKTIFLFRTEEVFDTLKTAVQDIIQYFK